MSCEAVYRTTGAPKLEDFVAKARVRMLGHVLRLDRNAPAQVSMDHYFQKGSRKPGRPRACLASAVKKDIERAGLRFGKKADLAQLREIAGDRVAWRGLVNSLTQRTNA